MWKTRQSSFLVTKPIADQCAGDTVNLGHVDLVWVPSEVCGRTVQGGMRIDLQPTAVVLHAPRDPRTSIFSRDLFWHIAYACERPCFDASL